MENNEYYAPPIHSVSSCISIDSFHFRSEKMFFVSKANFGILSIHSNFTCVQGQVIYQHQIDL